MLLNILQCLGQPEGRVIQSQMSLVPRLRNADLEEGRKGRRKERGREERRKGREGGKKEERKEEGREEVGKEGGKEGGNILISPTNQHRVRSLKILISFISP